MTSRDSAAGSYKKSEEGVNKGFVFDPDDIPLPKSGSRFRFKSKGASQKDTEGGRNTRSSKRRRTESFDKTSSHENRPQRPHHGHRHRHHGSKRGETGTGEEETTGARNRTPLNQVPEMDSETAFRESLFDAMADDEGAAFWEGVYGQPIHTYSNTKPADPDDPASDLQHMSDEEYVAYVRQQMWEKSHQHVIEERKRREEAAQRRREEVRRARVMEGEKEAFDRKIEESLRRGEQRKAARAWRDAWTVYTRRWEKLLARGKANTESAEDTNLIPWPNRSGKQQDISKDEVAAFFQQAPSKEASSEQRLRSVLKSERIRWHPDKMQQRFGQTKLDADTMKAVVAVFQIVDDLWAQTSTEKK